MKYTTGHRNAVKITSLHDFPLPITTNPILDPKSQLTWNPLCLNSGIAYHAGSYILLIHVYTLLIQIDTVSSPAFHFLSYLKKTQTTKYFLQ